MHFGIVFMPKYSVYIKFLSIFSSFVALSANVILAVPVSKYFLAAERQKNHTNKSDMEKPGKGLSTCINCVNYKLKTLTVLKILLYKVIKN
jgi:hypothetical protein